MIVARFWSKHKHTFLYEHNGTQKQLTIERWGWGQDSQEQAQACAQKRVADARDVWEQTRNQKPSSFWKGWKKEAKVPYCGADGMPIREEILQDEGEDGVLTRNSYGVHCLNTQHMFVADIDADDLSFKNPHLASGLFVVVVLGCFSVLLFSHKGLWMSLILGLVLGVPVAFGIKMLLWQLYVLFVGGLSNIVKERLLEHPGLSFRLYETPKGFRVLETSKTFEASSRETQDLFLALQTDKLYALMCQKQLCFRARVSGKPWRMNMERMPQALWPIEDTSKLQKRQEWVVRYEAKKEDFAACRLLGVVGAPRVSQRVEKTLLWHDRLACDESKPLA